MLRGIAHEGRAFRCDLGRCLEAALAVEREVLLPEAREVAELVQGHVHGWRSGPMRISGDKVLIRSGSCAVMRRMESSGDGRHT